MRVRWDERYNYPEIVGQLSGESSVHDIIPIGIPSLLNPKFSLMALSYSILSFVFCQ
jgi:hypothetical protein